MTDLLLFLLRWACSVLLFLASCARDHAKLLPRGSRHRGRRMTAAATAAATPSPPSPSGATWSKRAAGADLVHGGEPVPAAKRSKEAAEQPVGRGAPGRGADGIGIGMPRRCGAGEAVLAVGAAAQGSQSAGGPVGHAQPPASPMGRDAAPALVLRRRPTMIVIPDQSSSSAARREFEKEAVAKKVREDAAAAPGGGCAVTEGDGYCAATRKGSRRAASEDGHAAITRIDGDPTQAYFGVFDGHGGRAAVDCVTENLGRNVVAALRQAEVAPADAIQRAYAATDRDFVSQELRGGACVATVVLKNGMLHAANAGDCRVVLSRGGRATALTSDHRAGRVDERHRIESTGGFVSCYGGGAVWRVQDSLSVTRSIGDAQLKQWVIPDPEVTELQLPRVSGGCEDDFLILASDGLWDHVANQEAVDVVLANGGCGARAARVLVDVPFARGGRDDVTVMLVRLRGFVQ